MMDLEKSYYEISLQRPYYMSDLEVPTPETIKIGKSITPAEVNGTRESSATSCSVCSTAESLTSLKSTADGSGELVQIQSPGKFVDCPFEAAGCTEKLPQGTITEKEHHQTCQYRPVPCLMQHVCKQLVPYHNFLLHHMQHFIYPTFSRILNTSVVFEREDFDCNQRWQPRWMNCSEKDFFVMISHKIPGMWYFWVWMVGTPEEAEHFSYDIEVCKGNSFKLAKFPVLSFRTTEDDLEKQEVCLSMTDSQIKRLSKIRENMVGSFDIGLIIQKVPSILSRILLISKD